jgi:hypothetical protein
MIQEHDAELLGHQLARETAGVLDSHHSDTIILDPVE